MQSGFRVIEHPADLGIEAYGNSMEEAFQQAARGLMSIILDLTTVRCRETLPLVVRADDQEQLLVRWLAEILYLYDGKKFAAREFHIQQFSTTELHAVVSGESFDVSKHRTLLDVKAVTYHQISITESSTGVVLKVFLDI